MKRILVTGGSGFLGRAIVSELSVNGYEVHTCSRTGTEIGQGVQVHKANLLDYADVAALFSDVRPAYLVHTAWCSGHGTYWTDPANLEWAAANTQIARRFVEEGGEYALFTGTSAEYDWTGNKAHHESDHAVPSSIYGGAKLGSYIAIRQYFAHSKVGLGWARLFNPFGAYEDERRLIPKICNRLLRGEKVEFDAGLEKRDFLYVDDLSSAYRLLLENRVDGLVNVASGIPVAVKDMVSLIAEAAGCPDAISFAEPKDGIEASVIVADVSKLKETTGWEPTLSLSNRIHQTVEWWKNKKQSK